MAKESDSRELSIGQRGLPRDQGFQVLPWSGRSALAETGLPQ